MSSPKASDPGGEMKVETATEKEVSKSKARSSRSRSPRRSESRGSPKSRRRRSSKSRSPKRSGSHSRSPTRHRRRSRSRGRSGRDRDRDRDRGRGRGRDYDRRDYDRRDYDRRDRYDRDHYGRRGRDYDHRDRYDRRDRHDRYDRDRHSRRDDRRGSPSRGRSEEKSLTEEQRAALRREKELAEVTRHARTIFVGQLVVRAKARDVKAYFEQVGKVNDVRLIEDKVTGRSKGIGYIEFAELESVPLAMGLNGKKFCMKHKACTCSGFPLLVKSSEAEKNFKHQAESREEALNEARRRIFVKNIAPDTEVQDLKVPFARYGTIVTVTMHKDESGKPKGQATIEFMEVESAHRALVDTIGVVVKGNKLDISTTRQQERAEKEANDPAVTDARRRAQLIAQIAGGVKQAAAHIQAGMTGSAPAAPVRPVAAPGVGGVAVAPGVGMAGAPVGPMGGMPGMGVPGMGMPGRGMPGAPMAMAGVVPGMAMPGVVPFNPLAAVMASSSGAVEHKATGTPSEFIVVHNVFNPETETEEGWDEDIAEDFKEEAETYGKVTRVFVDKTSKGDVYIQFHDMDSATAAGNKVAGRTFDQRTLTVEFLSGAQFAAIVPPMSTK